MLPFGGAKIIFTGFSIGLFFDIEDLFVLSIDEFVLMDDQNICSNKQMSMEQDTFCWMCL